MAAPSSHWFECSDCGLTLGNGPSMPSMCPCGSRVVTIRCRPAHESPAWEALYGSPKPIERESDKELCSVDGLTADLGHNQIMDALVFKPCPPGEPVVVDRDGFLRAGMREPFAADAVLLNERSGELADLVDDVKRGSNCPEPGCNCPYIHGLTIPCNKCGHAPAEKPIEPKGAL